jgi:hypothetical protein
MLLLTHKRFLLLQQIKSIQSDIYFVDPLSFLKTLKPKNLKGGPPGGRGRRQEKGEGGLKFLSGVAVNYKMNIIERATHKLVHSKTILYGFG